MEEAEEEAEDEAMEDGEEEEGEEEEGEEGEGEEQSVVEESDDDDDIDWQEELRRKAEQLRGLLRPLNPVDGTLHPDDEREIDLVLRARGVSQRQKYEGYEHNVM